MGLSIALNNALTGLNVNQNALTVLSQNIANANTPGYSRQLVNQQSVSLDGVGEGVSIQDVTRKIDEYLTKSVQGQNSEVGKSAVLDDYYTRIQLLLGTPGGKNSIDSYTNNFFNSLQSLSQTPQDTTLQQGAVNNGVALANQIQQLAQGLQGLQFQADQDVTHAISAVNNDLSDLNTNNQQVASNLALGKSVADLQDKRDALVKDIAQYMNVSTFTRTNGTVSLTTAGGVTMLDDNLYQLSYTPAGSGTAFSDGSSLSAIKISRLDSNGTPIPSTEIALASGGLPSKETTVLTTGKISGLISLRDQQIPNILNQLDTLSSAMRDQFNAVHNQGTGFPGASVLTGTRAVYATNNNQWQGKVQIAVLNANGQAVPSTYPDEPNGVQPLTLDLSKLDTGQGPGNPTVQGVVDAINQYYGVPQTKVEVGNLNNIQLVSDNTSLPANPPYLNFDFDLNNISKNSSNFYVTSVNVQDNLGTSLPAPTSTVPTVKLSPSNTYITQAGSNDVIVSTTGTSNLTNGETVFLSTPPGPPATVDGIPNAQLGGFFTISNVTANSFQIKAATAASAGALTNVANMTATPPYTNVAAGSDVRTQPNGQFLADLSLSPPTAAYFNVTVGVGVIDSAGNVTQSQITYRVNNNQPSMLNTHYGASAATGAATLVQPTLLRPVATAKLVDANGNELPKINGNYTSQQSGFLQIQAGLSTQTIAIDSLDSLETGQPNNNPAVPGTNRGFSHYFELNNFFESNQPTNTGDTVANSALNMQVEQRFQTNPGLLSLGKLTQASQPVDPNAPANYTYERNLGDNTVIQKMVALATVTTDFPNSGGLPATIQTFSGYAVQIIGATSANSSSAKTNSANAQTLFDGYSQRASAISGVNLDTELANTVVYQNAYSASARVITVANALFDTLLQAVQ